MKNHPPLARLFHFRVCHGFVWSPFIGTIITFSLLIDFFHHLTNIYIVFNHLQWVVGSQTCTFLASLALLFVRDPKLNIQTLVITFFIDSVFVSIQDASVDAQAIATIPLNERGRINDFMRGGFLVGSALGAAGLTRILRNINYSTAASINSTFLLIFTLITFFIKENADDQLFPFTRKRSSKLQRHYQLKHDYSISKLFYELFKDLLSWSSLRLFIPILIVYASQAAFMRDYIS